MKCQHCIYSNQEWNSIMDELMLMCAINRAPAPGECDKPAHGGGVMYMREVGSDDAD